MFDTSILVEEERKEERKNMGLVLVSPDHAGSFNLLNQHIYISLSSENKTWGTKEANSE